VFADEKGDWVDMGIAHGIGPHKNLDKGHWMTAKVTSVGHSVGFVYTDSRVTLKNGKPRHGEADWKHWERIKPAWAEKGSCVEVYLPSRNQWIEGTVTEVYQDKPMFGVRRGEIGVHFQIAPGMAEVRWNHEDTVKGSVCLQKLHNTLFSARKRADLAVAELSKLEQATAQLPPTQRDMMRPHISSQRAKVAQLKLDAAAAETAWRRALTTTDKSSSAASPSTD
jgi:hypothetical protein